MFSRRAHLLFVLVCFALAVAGGCGGDSGGASADVDTATTAPSDGPPSDRPDGPVIVAKGLAFKPAEVKIDAGESVTWRFEDGSVAHNVVGDGFKSDLERKGTFTHTFPKAGEFSYRCTVHPGMKGTVVVS